MTSVLQADDMLCTASGVRCRVVRLLGSGGQGEVHEADLDGAAVAIKWYYPATATPEQRATIATLVERGAPSSRFLWPLDLVSADRRDGFGYVMPLRDARFRSVSELLRRSVITSFRGLATASVQLADSFLALHARGLSYRDISHGNVFFDPANGDVLICDNDNVAPDGRDAAVMGTPRFMAPEIVRGEALPSTQTDLFSLAVLLFLFLVNHHPLEGRREAAIHSFDLPAMTRLYGLDPVFIFDPEDTSNRPVPGLHDNALVFWPLYPEFLRQRFVGIFTDGLHDPQRRVRESEWRATAARLLDCIVYCPACGSQVFHDAEVLKAPGQAGSCWSCRTPLTLPPRIRVGKAVVMLNHDSKLYRHHIDPQAPVDLNMVVGEVVEHPQRPGLWGLRNLTATTWTATMADGAVKPVDPGRSVSLALGTRVSFGTSEGEIRLS